MLKRIAPDQVVPGMYVRRFEGSWLHHPFWRARFVVRTERQLRRIRQSGVHLFIDPDRGADLAPELPRQSPVIARHPVRAAPIARTMPAADAVVSCVRHKPIRVKAPPAFGKADQARAAALAQRSTKVVKALFDASQLGRTISTGPILSVVDDIATTLERSGAAFLKVTRLRTKDDALYTHSVAVCALMIGLARETGCSASAVQALGTAGLLHDVGKIALDDTLLVKSGTLSEGDWAELRRHPQLGHGVLAGDAGLPPSALDVCLHHHERLDGSGYPFGLRGEGVSHAVRMAAICDVYEALTAGLPGRPGLPPVEALAQMEAEGVKFDASLLFKFMRSIGVFPPGKLIRLRSNRLAITLLPAGEDLRPLARAFYSTVDTCFLPLADIVLSDRLSDDQAVSEEDPAKWFAGDWDTMRTAIATRKPLPAAMVNAA